MSGTPHIEPNPANVAARTQTATPPARKTFMEQAEADIKACQDFINNPWTWLYTTKRQAVVTLLEQRLNEAREKGYDDDLYTAYLDIKSFAERHWYYENPFLSTINTTLDKIQRKKVMREQSDNGRLSDQNVQLQEVNRRLEQTNIQLRESERLALVARDVQAQAVEAKSKLIQEKDKTILGITHKHSQLVAELKDTNTRMDRLQARLDGHFKECPTQKSKSSQKTSRYEPRLIGGSAARSEEKAYYRSSPKKPGGHSSPTSTQR